MKDNSKDHDIEYLDDVIVGELYNWDGTTGLYNNNVTTKIGEPRVVRIEKIYFYRAIILDTDGKNEMGIHPLSLSKIPGRNYAR